MQSGPSGELLEGLLSGRLDAALVDGPLEFAGLDGVPLCDERLVLITEADPPPVRSALDVEGRSVFTFLQGCSYRMRLGPGSRMTMLRWAGRWRSNPIRACSPV